MTLKDMLDPDIIRAQHIADLRYNMEVFENKGNTFMVNQIVKELKYYGVQL